MNSEELFAYGQTVLFYCRKALADVRLVQESLLRGITDDKRKINAF